MMEADQTKRYLIEYKSILLDVIEKYKTFERVNLSRFLLEFENRALPENLTSYILSEIVRPDRFELDKFSGEILYERIDGDESDDFYESMAELDSIFVNEVPPSEKYRVSKLKMEELNPEKRYLLVVSNPHLPDGLMLKFRKCRSVLYSLLTGRPQGVQNLEPF